MTHVWTALCFFILSPITQAMGNNAVHQALSRPCSTCHGSHGQSLNPAWPHLAGQQTSYLEKQLHDLQLNETRHPDEAMAPFIISLTDEDITNLAMYYAALPRPPGSHRHRKKNTQGETLYREGNPDKHILACITCHGNKAEGNGLPGFPSLAGQQLTYLVHQLEAFKTGARDNDPSHAMHAITQGMSADDIYAVAHYLASLPE